MAKRERGRIAINSLGSLEVDVMAIIWKMKKATVKDVFEILYEKRRLAYTTIMTVMSRLAAKGILAQDRATVPYVYKPLIGRDQMATSMVREVVDRVLDGSGEVLVSYLIKKGKVSEAELDRLQELVNSSKS